jgi:hypothetical protein
LPDSQASEISARRAEQGGSVRKNGGDTGATLEFMVDAFDGV